MSGEYYIVRGRERLRCGYTTGSCAAMAAASSCRMLLTQQPCRSVSLVTPGGITVLADVEQAEFAADYACCAVRKDAGDDCDATDKMLIFARCEYSDSVLSGGTDGITVTGGYGIGIVTRPGLDRPVGEYAINSVPLEMIKRETEKVCRELGHTGGMRITIYAPEGVQRAERTFNSRLGIEGGISILGTSGIVEPQSVAALIDSIGLEIGQFAAEGHDRLVLAPGNYAEKYIGEKLCLAGVPTVKCANNIGAALDFAAVHGFCEVLIVSHIGKAVKLAGGIMDTHSRTADCRAELFAAHAACCGADTDTVRALMESTVTESCLELLTKKGLLEATLQSLFYAMQLHLERRAAGAFSVGALTFRNGYLPLGGTEKGLSLLKAWRV